MKKEDISRATPSTKTTPNVVDGKLFANKHLILHKSFNILILVTKLRLTDECILHKPFEQNAWCLSFFSLRFQTTL